MNEHGPAERPSRMLKVTLSFAQLGRIWRWIRRPRAAKEK